MAKKSLNIWVIILIVIVVAVLASFLTFKMTGNVAYGSNVYYCVEGQRVGDLNGDWLINSHDSNLASRIAVGLTNSSPNSCCADVNKDGKVDISDVVLIQRIAKGLDVSPGVCLDSYTSNETYDQIIELERDNLNSTKYKEIYNQINDVRTLASCYKYDFNCDSAINSADDQVIASLWKSGYKINVNSATSQKCGNLAAYLGQLWKNGKTKIPIGDVTEMTRKIYLCANQDYP